MQPLRNASLLAGLALATFCTYAPAQPAQLAVEGAWARATVQGQSGTGAFMTLTAREPLTLTGVATPVAGVAEVHEMKMEGDVMKMRAVAALELPAGKAVELKPGGYHLMLMDLKAPLQPGTQVPVTLRLRNAKGVTSTLDLRLPVAVRPPAGAAAAPAASMHKH